MLRDSDVRLVEEYSNLMQLDLASVLWLISGVIATADVMSRLPSDFA